MSPNVDTGSQEDLILEMKKLRSENHSLRDWNQELITQNKTLVAQNRNLKEENQVLENNKRELKAEIDLLMTKKDKLTEGQKEEKGKGHSRSTKTVEAADAAESQMFYDEDDYFDEAVATKQHQRSPSLVEDSPTPEDHLKNSLFKSEDFAEKTYEELKRDFELRLRAPLKDVQFGKGDDMYLDRTLTADDYDFEWPLRTQIKPGQCNSYFNRLKTVKFDIYCAKDNETFGKACSRLGKDPAFAFKLTKFLNPHASEMETPLWRFKSRFLAVLSFERI